MVKIYEGENDAGLWLMARKLLLALGIDSVNRGLGVNMFRLSKSYLDHGLALPVKVTSLYGSVLSP